MKKSNTLILASLASLALSALLASGALAADPQPAKVLATVGKDSITQSDLDAAMQGLNPQQRAVYDSPEGRAEMLQNLVDFKLFAMMGRDMKLQDTAEYKKAMENFEQALLFKMATEKILQDGRSAAVSDADAQKFYDEHKAIFVVPAAGKASHILIEVAKDAPAKDVKAARAKAAALLKDIRSGKISFEDAAKENSSCPSKNRGGDLGFFAKGQMVKPFEDAAFALKKDEMAKEPVRSDFGFHIIKVTDTRNAVTRPFSEMKDDIKGELANQKQMEALNKAKQDLRNRYNVKILTDAKPEAIKPSAK